MIDAVLQSKLVWPGLRRELVTRPRLTVELDRAQDAALVRCPRRPGSARQRCLRLC